MSEKGWHFVGDTLRDGSPVPADGEWLEYDGPLVMCKSGLHYSRDPFDALQYAPGSILCSVTVDGVEEYGEDKGVARRRRIDDRIDATDLLRSFARQCALDVIHLWDAPEVVREYLETGDETKRDAAQAAAWDAAWDAGRDAARTASRDAARAAALAAARAAARDAAWTTALAASRDAARDPQRTRFNEMVAEAFGGEG